MVTIRERIEMETRNSEANSIRGWTDETIGDFICFAAPNKWPEGCLWNSEALLATGITDEELEAAYAKWCIEKGE